MKKKHIDYLQKMKAQQSEQIKKGYQLDKKFENFKPEIRENEKKVYK